MLRSRGGTLRRRGRAPGERAAEPWRSSPRRDALPPPTTLPSSSAPSRRAAAIPPSRTAAPPSQAAPPPLPHPAAASASSPRGARRRSPGSSLSMCAASPEERRGKKTQGKRKEKRERGKRKSQRGRRGAAACGTERELIDRKFGNLRLPVDSSWGAQTPVYLCAWGRDPNCSTCSTRGSTLSRAIMT